MLQGSLLVSSIANECSSDDTAFEAENNTHNMAIKEKSKGPNSISINTNVSSVVIHVCDESRNLDKSFQCNRQLLIDKMAYFKQYLTTDSQDEEEEVDISVHCDILVFEWLIQYISNETKPILEIHNVVSILISSHFLQMNELVNDCIHFMSANLSEIIELPLDLSCLNDEIVTRISRKLDVLTIDSFHDPSDKIMSRLYKYHLELFLSKKENKLFFCAHCGALYTKEQRKKLICYKSPIFINFHGQIVRKHCAQRGWYIGKYLLGLRLQNYSYQSIYWHLWALTKPALFCYKCDEYIAIPKLYHCTYHSKQSINKGLNTMLYPCCQATENNFEIIQNQKKGCSHKQHQIISENNAEQMQKLLDIITAHSQYMIIPFESSNVSSVTTTNKRFSERPQTADHRSRLLKHSHQNHKIKKRFSLNSPPKTTGVWDKKYFVFGSQSSSKALNRNHLNNNNFDMYHKPVSFWYNEQSQNGTKNDDITEDSFEYLSYLLAFDNIDYEGEGDDSIKPIFDSEEEGLFTDDGSVNMEDVNDVMFLQSNSQSVNAHSMDEVRSPKHSNKKKCKAMPIRGRRLKGMSSKGSFSVDVKQSNKSSSLFGIQQNDIRRLDALMKSLSQNRQT